MGDEEEKKRLHAFVCRRVLVDNKHTPARIRRARRLFVGGLCLVLRVFRMRMAVCLDCGLCTQRFPIHMLSFTASQTYYEHEQTQLYTEAQTEQENNWLIIYEKLKSVQSYYYN